MRRSDTAYRHFTDEEIERANRVDILDLARGYGYEPEKSGHKAIHLKHSGGLYVFPESNRFFHWTGGESEKKGGAVDFVMREENLSFGEAVGKLIGAEYVTSTREVRPYQKEEKGPLVLPEKADNFKQAYWYLVSVRGIEPEIVSHFMNQKMIYQDAKYRNCVFVGYDSSGEPKYCSKRATWEKSKIQRLDAENSDKSYPWAHVGSSDLLIVNEAPIDVMSHATLAKVYFGQDWKRDHRLSLGCLWNGALDRYLTEHPEIKRLVFAVDNDYLACDKKGVLTNWGQLSARKWVKEYTARGYECAVHVPHLNDFNLDLTEMRKGRSPEDLDRQREAELLAEFERDADPEPEKEPDEEMEA